MAGGVRWPGTLRWRVYGLVGGLVLLLLLTASVTVFSRLNVAAVDQRLDDTLRPAEASVAALTKGYIDMETGERGFLLTGDQQFLQPYEAGQVAVADAREDLRRQFSDDPESLRLLAAVDQAGDDWESLSAQPEIAAGRGDLMGAALLSSTLSGKQRFDTLRSRLTELQNRIDALTTDATRAASGTQIQATLITGACAVLALAIGAATVVFVRRSLVRPVNQLLGDVRQVSAGDLDHQVSGVGPREVTELGRAVEAMRVRIRTEIAHASEAAEEIARLEEVDRIARDVGARVSTELFTTSLAVQSTASRFPNARHALATVTTGIDRALNELRLAMYGQVATARRQSLAARVTALISELEPVLGHAPELRLHGDVNRTPDTRTCNEVLAALRDALTALAGPAVVELTVSEDRLRLVVTGVARDDAALDVLAGLPTRARDSGGTATVRKQDGHTIVDWQSSI